MPSVETKVAGTSFLPGYPKNFYKWAQLESGRYPKCTLVRDPDNESDPNAVKVKVGRSVVGFVPADLASRVAEVMDSGVEVTCQVTTVEVIPDLAANPTMRIRITRN